MAAADKYVLISPAMAAPSAKQAAEETQQAEGPRRCKDLRVGESIYVHEVLPYSSHTFSNPPPPPVRREIMEIHPDPNGRLVHFVLRDPITLSQEWETYDLEAFAPLE